MTKAAKKSSRGRNQDRARVRQHYEISYTAKDQTIGRKLEHSQAGEAALGR
jgi:hypothetical protein